LRKIAAAILAVPVLAVLYLPVLRRRGVAIRAGLAVGAGLLVLVAAVGALPRAASALPPVAAGPVAGVPQLNAPVGMRTAAAEHETGLQMGLQSRSE